MYVLCSRVADFKAWCSLWPSFSKELSTRSGMETSVQIFKRTWHVGCRTLMRLWTSAAGWWVMSSFENLAFYTITNHRLSHFIQLTCRFFFIHRRNLVEGITTSYLKKCTYHKNKDPFCPVFELGYIVKESGQNFHALALKVHRFQVMCASVMRMRGHMRLTWNGFCFFGQWSEKSVISTALYLDP